MTETKSNEKWLTIIEVAALYGVSKQAVRNWISDGLPCRKKKEIGKKAFIVIDSSIIDSYLGLGVR
jgi:phage terminase Nu1 subunit (DNA packaging protein)